MANLINIPTRLLEEDFERIKTKSDELLDKFGLNDETIKLVRLQQELARELDLRSDRTITTKSGIRFRQNEVRQVLKKAHPNGCIDLLLILEDGMQVEITEEEIYNGKHLPPFSQQIGQGKLIREIIERFEINELICFVCGAQGKCGFDRRSVWILFCGNCNFQIESQDKEKLMANWKNQTIL